MKIIDAHIHFAKTPHFDDSAKAAGHENTVEHLTQVFERNHIVLAIAMGSGTHDGPAGVCYPTTLNLAGKLDLEQYNQPKYMAYCCGVESEALTPQNRKASLEAFDRHLRTKECVGIKLYPGYNSVYLDDERHYPLYELAQYYDVPVVIHTGDTASPHGLLKYSHPLTVDDVAVKFPKVRFVMAHFGTPWLADAAAVADKNDNVFIDLSGLAEGNFTAEEYCESHRGYMEQLRTWMEYLESYEKFLYGSDWPIVNVDAYIEIISRLVPEKYHSMVFYENAKRVFPKICDLGVV